MQRLKIKSKEIFLQIKSSIILALKNVKKSVQTRDNRLSSVIILALCGGSLLVAFVAGFLKFQEDTSMMEVQQINSVENVVSTQPNATSRLGETSKEKFYQKADGELALLVQKANILYNNGNIEDALDLFEKIAVYSQSLANYNFGVIQLDEKKYEDALQSFQKAIDTGDDVSLSAINAAYISYKIGDPQKFKHYLQLAQGKLADSVKTPFYSYLYGVTSYYKKQYFEALSPLLHPNTKDYSKQNIQLASKIFLVLGDDYNALQALKTNPSDQDKLALGMLYARNGDYVNAREVILQYLQTYPQSVEALSALELVELKLRRYLDASTILSSFVEKEIRPTFKIKTGLNEHLFDINQVQKNFWNRQFESSQSLQYKILFYYAPYKVFDSNEVFEVLADAGFEWDTGRVEESENTFIKSKSISRINRDIAKGLKEVYAGDLRKGLQIFLENAKNYSQHPVLYYDIGLLYAQLGDFENAFYYFNRAYHLDSKDIMAGIFTMISGKLTYRDTTRIESSIATDLVGYVFENELQKLFLLDLFEYVRSDKGVTILWDKDEPQNMQTFYYVFAAINAMRKGEIKEVQEYFVKIKQKYPNDLATSVMNEVAQNYQENLKEISLKFSEFFRKGSFSNMHALHYGGALPRELYIRLAFVTGNLSFVITQLQEKLVLEDRSHNGTMQALGLAYIYNQEFEKAFAIYNDLIDNLKENDAKTKFLGAVAAIGAKHYSNAVALLQISKIDSNATLESRYALGLLYQQQGNLRSAFSLFQSVADKGFISEFFDFSIDTSELLEEANR